MTLPDESQRAHQLALTIAGRDSVGLYERLDAHDVVGTLVPDYLCRGEIHHLYVLRHDDVGCHL